MKKTFGEDILAWLLLPGNEDATVARFAATRGVGIAQVQAVAEAALNRVRALQAARDEWAEQ